MPCGLLQWHATYIWPFSISTTQRDFDLWRSGIFWRVMEYHSFQPLCISSYTLLMVLDSTATLLYGAGCHRTLMSSVSLRSMLLSGEWTWIFSRLIKSNTYQDCNSHNFRHLHPRWKGNLQETPTALRLWPYRSWQYDIGQLIPKHKDHRGSRDKWRYAWCIIRQ